MTNQKSTTGLLVLATGNRHKVSEMKQIFASLDMKINSMADYPELGEVEEDGETFAANAVKKAVQVALQTGEFALADDSGLEVTALEGRPGIRSARYAPTNNERLAKVLHELKEARTRDRSARFVCAMALADPRGYAIVREGVCEGQITQSLLGSGGFGYDPIFFVPEAGQTMAQLSARAKNRISHRGRAAQAMAELIEGAVCQGKDLRDFGDYHHQDSLNPHEI